MALIKKPHKKRKVTMNREQLAKIATGHGFIAALDQSGGSTPKTLAAYGVPATAYTDDAQMFELVHQMRTRIITSPAFTGDYILGAILFERTLDSQIGNLPTADYLWQEKKIVPFLKIDQGLALENNDVQLMQDFPELDNLLTKAVGKGVFGTKMRSLIKSANQAGIEAVVAQQFDWAKKIIAHDLVPIVEPEVAIDIPDKADAEIMLKAAIEKQLTALPFGKQIMLKLSLPSLDNFYRSFVENPHVLRVVALSGGYPQTEANLRLARNQGVVASFSRALLENLSAQQTPEEFDRTLGHSIQEIYAASVT